MRGLAFLMLIAALVQPPLSFAQESLGRLFFTPQERAELDRRRASKIQEAAPVVRADTLTLQGYVTRSSGKTTIWLNGTPRNDEYRSADPARVRIKQGENDPEIELKVGQTLDRVRGETRGLLGDGQIRVEPAAR